MERYTIERKDTKNFHGFILFENMGCIMDEIGKYSTLAEAVKAKKAAESFDENLAELTSQRYTEEQAH